MIEIDKKNLLYCLLAVLLIVVLCFCFRVQNNGGGIDEARDVIDRAVGEQQQTIDDLERVESGLADSADRIGRTEKSLADIADRLGDGETTLTEDAERLAECQRILADIRRRGATDGR